MNAAGPGPASSSPSVSTPPSAPGRLGRFAMSVLWPSFLMAGVGSMLLFAVVDPGELSWFGGEHLRWSRQLVYSLGFFSLWLLVALACSITLSLATAPEPHPQAHPRRWPQ